MKIENGVLINIDTTDIVNGALKIPEEVTVIGARAITKQPQLTELILPETLIEIQEEGISQTGITELRIGPNVERLKDKALQGNENLTYIKVTNVKMQYEKNTFQGCVKLQRINFGAMPYNVVMSQDNIWTIDSSENINGVNVLKLVPFRAEGQGWYLAYKDDIQGAGRNKSAALAIVSERQRHKSDPNYRNINLYDWVSYGFLLELTGEEEQIQKVMQDKHDWGKTVIVEEFLEKTRGTFVANKVRQILLEAHRKKEKESVKVLVKKARELAMQFDKNHSQGGSV